MNKKIIRKIFLGLFASLAIIQACQMSNIDKNNLGKTDKKVEFVDIKDGKPHIFNIKASNISTSNLITIKSVDNKNIFSTKATQTGGGNSGIGAVGVPIGWSFTPTGSATAVYNPDAKSFELSFSLTQTQNYSTSGRYWDAPNQVYVPVTMAQSRTFSMSGKINLSGTDSTQPYTGTGSVQVNYNYDGQHVNGYDALCSITETASLPVTVNASVNFIVPFSKATISLNFTGQGGSYHYEANCGSYSGTHDVSAYSSGSAIFDTDLTPEPTPTPVQTPVPTPLPTPVPTPTPESCGCNAPAFSTQGFKIKGVGD
ncbi:MAG: hypothetical protein AABZ74_01960, partial [Cyanobacteriota bacterium]